MPVFTAIAALTLLAFPAGEGHPAAGAINDTWDAVQCGSTDRFLQSLDEPTADAVLMQCSELLELLRSRSQTELMLLFAAMRLEAAPGEVTNWDDRSMLEVILTAPGHAYYLENCQMLIDSMNPGESSATVWVSVRIPDGDYYPFEVNAVSTSSGWRTTGIDDLFATFSGGRSDS